MNHTTSISGIWHSPGQVAREHAGGLSVGFRFLLVWLWGVAYAFEKGLSRKAMADMSLLSALLLPVGIGLFGGAVYFFSLAFAIRMANRWFGGEATFRRIFDALLLGGIPRIFASLGVVALVVVFGETVLQKTPIKSVLSGGSLAVYYFVVLFMAGLALWSTVSTAHCMAEVQDYASAWRGFFHVWVSWVLLIVTVAVLYLAVFIFWKLLTRTA